MIDRMMDNLPYVIEPMSLKDVDEVMEIERSSFSMPWSESAYRYELRESNYSYYFVLRRKPPIRRLFQRHSEMPVLGYGGFWLLGDEAHISTLAVKQEYRGQRLGELILLYMLDKAAELGAEVATLEVRVSNAVAQNLYLKYGFQRVGLRPRYYNDNGEDALIMTTEPLGSISFQLRLQNLKKALREKLLSGQKEPIDVKF
ncbi:MAG: ribosomal protein S18-alanine N-acetyltransferase [Anaerolineae bacterium]